MTWHRNKHSNWGRDSTHKRHEQGSEERLSYNLVPLNNQVNELTCETNLIYLAFFGCILLAKILDIQYKPCQELPGDPNISN